MLDEGVGGSLKTHLQEVLPCYKGEQSLTFKRHQGSTVARCTEGAHPQNRPKLTAHLLPLMSGINRKVWSWNTQNTILSLEHATLKEPWSWNTEYLKTQPILYQKTLACYPEIRLPVREGDNGDAYDDYDDEKDNDAEVHNRRKCEKSNFSNLSHNLSVLCTKNISHCQPNLPSSAKDRWQERKVSRKSKVKILKLTKLQILFVCLYRFIGTEVYHVKNGSVALISVVIDVFIWGRGQSRLGLSEFTQILFFSFLMADIWQTSE